jgi:hypothetical protein
VKEGKKEGRWRKEDEGRKVEEGRKVGRNTTFLLSQ